jgi:hypothetical protein
VRRAPWHARLKKFLFIILPAILVLVVGLAVYFGVSLYRLIHPPPTPVTVNPGHYLLTAVDVSWTSKDGTETAGWWIPATSGAPGILLSPGYGMSRADTLSLASPLKSNGFNLLIYEQRGCGSTPKGTSSLGLRETDDMVAALDFLSNQPGVDRGRIGIWGVDLGARSALKAATLRPEVRAIVADSAFEKVTDFLAVKIREELRWNSTFLSFGLRQAFRIYFFESRASMNEGIQLGSLADRSIFFIQGENRLEMARLTAAIYEQVQPQKEMILLPVAKSRVMNEEETANYNRQVTNFFVANLPKAKATR